ncbi:MAG TPA: ferrochelatase [Kiritimatiellia bacterium]|nr:ferrochelatase [Kiritimatiellia bacterium]
MNTSWKYDAILVMSFGGPEGMDDVMPFLDNVLRGRNVPEERKLEVAHHYERFGGVSPINQQNRAIIADLRAELDRAGIPLPIYFGNRNWHPMISDTLRDMREAGVRRFLVLTTSAFSCYSGCRQYREDIQRACDASGPNPPTFDKIRVFFNHPDFIDINRDRILDALNTFPEPRRAGVHVSFTAHSIPLAMANNCKYEAQLRNASELTAAAANTPSWSLVYQSRSGPPSQPWLEPDILDHLRDLHAQGVHDVIISPIGFLSDHMEVLFDLDTEARELSEELGITMIRAKTSSDHPRFAPMLRELIEERLLDLPTRRTVGEMPPKHDVCPEACCLSGRPEHPAHRHPAEAGR